VFDQQSQSLSPEFTHDASGDSPTVEAVVALLAVGGETHGHMIRRSRFLKCFEVATAACGRKALAIELSDSTNLVAGVAVGDGMSADQRKAVLMLVYVVNRNLPAVRAMAEIALRAVFPSMEIGVAILAIAAHIAEHGIDVAFLAPHANVHPAQGKSGFAVIELRFAADRPKG
jgi:hypothetical protein